LALEHPDELIKRVRPLEQSVSPIIREIIISAYAKLPAVHADIGIAWLLDDPARFRVGPGYREPEWMPAVRLVEALSPHCSEALFRKLENAIVHYHAPEEKRDADYCLKASRKGYFGHYWGEAQYFLLPALDKKRIHVTTADLIRVLKRKFKNYPEERFLRGGIGSGGTVGSKLDPNLEKISDRAWLRIISSEKVPKSDNQKMVQVDPDHVVESSVYQFAQSLNRIAKRYPERFGRLALHFPETVDPNYLSAIIEAFGQKHPAENLSEDEKKSWIPAQLKTIEAVLAKYHKGDDRNAAMSFCRLIEQRADQNWPEWVISRLVQYARNHPDLPPGKLNFHCNKSSDEASVEMLFQNTINCVRGVAAEGIGSLLWKQKDRLDQVKPGIESLVHDPHPAVRMAAIEAIEPVLNIDRDLAVQWFCEACRDDSRVAASPRALQFFNYIIPSHIKQVTPIIQQMVESSWGEVALKGAYQVTARWIFHDFYGKEVEDCCRGNAYQREGVVTAAAQLLPDRTYFPKCREILLRFLNDADKNVRDALNNVFMGFNVDLDDPEFYEFYLECMRSQTFADNPDILFHILESYPGRLMHISESIISLCNEFATRFKEKSRDIGSNYPYTAQKMLPILLHLYEQALGEHDRKVVSQCLDVWDVLFENRVGRAIELTRSIES